MNYEELVKSKKNIGDMTKKELFTYCGGLLSEVWDYEKENIDLQNQLQQKENIIKEVRKMLYKRDKDDYDTYTANVLCDIQSDFEEILRGEY